MRNHQKRAFNLGGALWTGAKGVAKAGVNAASGAIGFGQFGSGPAAYLGHGAGKVYNMASGLMPIAGPLASQAGFKNPLTGEKIGSITGSPLLDAFAKQAFHMSPADLIDAGAYGAFAASKFVDPHEHPLLHTALDAGALAALAGTTGYGMLAGKDDYKPGMKDLVGLGLMGSALYDRAKSH